MVWEGRSREASPYPDFVGASARLIIWRFRCEPSNTFGLNRNVTPLPRWRIFGSEARVLAAVSDRVGLSSIVGYIAVVPGPQRLNEKRERLPVLPLLQFRRLTKRRSSNQFPRRYE